MSRTIHKTLEPVVLEGYQAILKPSKFGYTLSALIGEDLQAALETDREEGLKWCQSRVSNPKRSVLKPEPWEEVESGELKVKFTWNEDNKPPIVDTEGTPVTDEDIPLYSGSTVKIAFYQKPYILNDKTTYGTCLKLVGVQVVTAGAGAGVDVGDLDLEDVVELFGTTQGFKVGEPNVMTKDTEEEDDF